MSVDTFPHFARRRDTPVSLPSSGGVSGLADITDRWQRFLDATGDFYVPPGIYNFTRLNIFENTRIVFAPGARLLLIDGSSHAIVLEGDKIVLDGVDLDCAGQVSGHGIRVGNCIDVTIHRFRIDNTNGYGIGIAQTTGTRTIRCTIDRGRISNAGQDCIDFKDTAGDNESNMVSRAVLVNPGVTDPGQPHAGLDMRGEVMADKIVVRELTANMVGIRFRENDGGITGFGCEGDTLSNFMVTGPGSIGVVSPSQRTHIHNGYIFDCNNGLQTGGEDVLVENVTARDAGVAGVAYLASATGNRTHFRNCNSLGFEDGYRIDGADCTIAGGTIDGVSRWGIRSNPGDGLRVQPEPVFRNIGTAPYSTTQVFVAAAAFAIPPHMDVFRVTGATAITSFTQTGTPRQNREITLVADSAGTWTLTHSAATIRLAGGVNFVCTTHDSITLTTDNGGALWKEKCRSVNG